VIPEQTYPQGADAFSPAFSKDAAEAEFIIQLLGPAEGCIPSDLKVSYPRYQAEIIASMEKLCLRWRPDLQLSQIRDTAYRRLLQDATSVRIWRGGFALLAPGFCHLTRSGHRSDNDPGGIGGAVLPAP